MPAEALGLRFYVDENSLGIAKALAVVRRDVVHPGHRLLPEVPLGALDTEWMPAVARLGLVVIGRDRRIRTKPAELAILRAHSLRVFWIAGKREMTNWGKLVRVVTRWDEMEQIIASRGPGPWFMAINENAIAEIPV